MLAIHDPFDPPPQPVHAVVRDSDQKPPPEPVPLKAGGAPGSAVSMDEQGTWYDAEGNRAHATARNPNVVEAQAAAPAPGTRPGASAAWRSWAQANRESLDRQGQAIGEGVGTAWDHFVDSGRAVAGPVLDAYDHALGGLGYSRTEADPEAGKPTVETFPAAPPSAGDGRTETPAAPPAPPPHTGPAEAPPRLPDRTETPDQSDELNVPDIYEAQIKVNQPLTGEVALLPINHMFSEVEWDVFGDRPPLPLGTINVFQPLFAALKAHGVDEVFLWYVASDSEPTISTGPDCAKGIQCAVAGPNFSDIFSCLDTVDALVGFEMFSRDLDWAFMDTAEDLCALGGTPEFMARYCAQFGGEEGARKFYYFYDLHMETIWSSWDQWWRLRAPYYDQVGWPYPRDMPHPNMCLD